MQRLQPNFQDIERHTELAMRDSGVCEVRIPQIVKLGTISGYFDTASALVDALRKESDKYAGIYVTLNTVNPATLARAQNRFMYNAKTTTSERDITKRKFLLMDFDPVRPAAISSTDEEHDRALNTAAHVRGELAKVNFPDPIFANSGNGAHLLYPVDGPNLPWATETVKQLLKALGQRFDNDEVKLDQSVFDASRVVKLYGTVSAKGDNTLHRPHRLSRLVDIPTRMVPLVLSEFDPSKALDDFEVDPIQIALGWGRGNSDQFSANGKQSSPVNAYEWLDSFLTRHGIQVLKREPWKDGLRVTLRACPFDPGHVGTSAAIFVFHDGHFGFKCQHQSCADKTWHYVLQHFEERNCSKSRFAIPEVCSAADLYQRQTPRVPGLLRSERTDVELLHEGLEMEVGRQKGGKTCMALQIAVAVSGGPQIEGLKAQNGRVLFGSLEESASRMEQRLRQLANEVGNWADNLHFFHELQSLMHGGAEQIHQMLATYKPRLLILDTLSALVRSSSKSNDIFRQHYEETSCLRKIAQEFQIACLLIHHVRKAGGIDPVEKVAGTGGLTAGVDGIWVLEAKPHGHVLNVLGREIPATTLALEFNKGLPFGWRFLGDAEELNHTGAWKTILDLLTTEPNQTPAEIADRTGMNSNTVRVTIRRMVEDGIISAYEGRYART